MYFILLYINLNICLVTSGYVSEYTVPKIEQSVKIFVDGQRNIQEA